MSLGTCPAVPDSMSQGSSDIYSSVQCTFVDTGTCPQGIFKFIMICLQFNIQFVICKCQFYCCFYFKGWYCPTYSSQQLAIPSVQNTLLASGCHTGATVTAITGNSALSVMCPCTPGFFCPTDTSLPIYCNEGYYCPSDTTITTDPFGAPIDQSTGYGTWGTKSFICPDGHWCATGQLVPFSCSLSNNQCPVGSTKNGNAPGFITIAIIIAAMVIAFFFLDWRTSRKKKLQLLMQLKELSTTEAAVGVDDYKS